MIVHPLELSQARAYVYRKAPYFAHGVWSLTPYPAPGCGTFGVTQGLVLYYDVEAINKITIPQLAGALVHELNHVLRGYWDRLPDAIPELKNIAADIPINEDLRDSGWELPNWAIYADTYKFDKGLTMEQYYRLLLDMIDQNAGSRRDGINQLIMSLPGVQQQHGNSTGNSTGSGPQQGQQQGGQGQSAKVPGPCGGICGGVAGNPIHQSVEQELDKEFGKSVEERKSIADHLAHSIQEAIKSGQGRGTIPSSFSEWAVQFKGPPKVKWTRLLTNKLKRAASQIESGASDYSMQRPSRRTYARDDGVIRPGLVDYKFEIGIILDTSGSMSQELLSKALREAAGAMKAANLDRCWFIQCDADVHSTKRIRIKDLAKLELRGRGGTDFVPALEQAAKIKPKISLVIYLTDGDGNAPNTPPPFDVIWCVFKSHYNRRPADWGEYILVEE